MSIIIAIDPGAFLTACMLPTSDEPAFLETADPEVLASSLKLWTSKKDGVKVLCERVGIRPGEDLNAGSKLVGSMYMTWGVCGALGLKLLFVDPAAWKRDLRVPGKGQPDALRRLCEMAGNTFPAAKPLFSVPSKHHNRADAALLAYWYRTVASQKVA